AEDRAPRPGGLEAVHEADVRAADGAAVDVVCGGEGLGQPGGAGRTEAGVGVVLDLVDDQVNQGVAPDVVVAGKAPAVGVLVGAALGFDLSVQASDAQFGRDLVVGRD